ncbi:hypothetical protein MTY66_63370 (plasmid) [Mycolicibacterium sp. TY66]|uniref:hypothetical protein n=2 Tax=unclassified Mycolicibacterium TaxID=2636767 RepID=UPI001BB43DD5|nr:hypothetical protein [Mycolicibacterium sp. TY66]BCI84712.1 hypothetical protein MTY66_63370 [Mycolicibacterium sp. TY66]BCJ84941.1 hypothetical protein MTY81_63140 [Mycolicibacterium sp. TY81]
MSCGYGQGVAGPAAQPPHHVDRDSIADLALDLGVGPGEFLMVREPLCASAFTVGEHPVPCAAAMIDDRYGVMVAAGRDRRQRVAVGAPGPCIAPVGHQVWNVGLGDRLDLRCDIAAAGMSDAAESIGLMKTTVQNSVWSADDSAAASREGWDLFACLILTADSGVV